MINVHHFTFNGFQENTYILFDETKECVIIDPGCYSNEEQQILADYISQNELSCFPKNRYDGTRTHLSVVQENVERSSLGST